MKSIKVITAVLTGFALSYVPNNFMEEKYEHIAFYIIVGLVILAVLGSVISNSKQKAD